MSRQKKENVFSRLPLPMHKPQKWVFGAEGIRFPCAVINEA